MDFNQLPTGLGMALSMNPDALNVYAAMTEEQKKNLLDRARNARSAQEMHQIVNGLVSHRDR